MVVNGCTGFSRLIRVIKLSCAKITGTPFPTSLGSVRV